MKIILSSPNLNEVAQLRNMLDRAGIACFMRNEVSAGLAPEIPLAEGLPELWIQADQDLAEALRIKAACQTVPPVGGANWVCPVCGETSEPQFTSCWKCGVNKT
jgi:hypothetical protein